MPDTLARAKSVHGVNVAQFISGYIGALLWSSNDESDESGGEPLDRNYSRDDLTADARERTDVECRAFLYRVGYFITEENFTGRYDDNLASRAGHDFWLTRNGHGAGFWDGDWTEHAGARMTATAKAFGELNPFVTDAQQVDFE